MAIGENIKSLRLQHGLSQAELAKIAGVSDKAVSSWEQNNSVPRMGAIQKMADFFGVQKSVIIETTSDPNDTIEARLAKNRLSLNIEEANLVFNYRNLNVNNRQIIDVMMALFLSQQSGGGDFDLNVAAV